ncbi:hypothetical protein DFH09DRAFT_1169953 [Mycena vulgaris]|nr:hypothetical protein DFH09DRAFT_1169953 [Mycena vulgaris]
MTQSISDRFRILTLKLPLLLTVSAIVLRFRQRIALVLTPPPPRLAMNRDGSSVGMICVIYTPGANMLCPNCMGQIFISPGRSNHEFVQPAAICHATRELLHGSAQFTRSIPHI